MQLTVFTDFSLRTLMYLGALEEDELATLNQISQVYGISLNHLKKIAWELNKSGYTESVYGRNGGYRLAKKPETIRIGKLIRRFENLDMVECMKEDGFCALKPVCKLKKALHEALEAYLEVLDSYTLSDLLTNKEELAIALFAHWNEETRQSH